MNYSKHVNVKKTPQTQAILGLNQVQNNAGGYVFPVEDEAILERFLTIGTEGGTYYVTEKKLTIDNAKEIIRMIQQRGVEVVQKLVTFSQGNRSPKQDPSIFVLSLACTYGDVHTKFAAYDAIATVCRTSTHLFTFVENVNSLRGWSRGLRRGINKFYLGKSLSDLGYQIAKYRQRNGWTHGDVIRLAHPKPEGSHAREYSFMFRYAIGKMLDGFFELGPHVQGYEAVRANPSASYAAQMIERCGLTWEMIPTELVNDKQVLEALLVKMPMTAMLRNLNRFATSGLTDNRISDATKKIVAALTNEEQLRRSRLHPVTILNTMKIYGRGRGEKSDKTWTPNPAIVAALEEAFELSFGYVQPTGKRVLYAVDSSGSMTSCQVGGFQLSCAEVAAALMLTAIRTESDSEFIFFDTKITPATANKRTSYQAVLRAVGQGGGTDCSLPFKHALKQGIKFDAIVTLTDSETWYGSQHPIQAYAQYKMAHAPACKGAVVAMVANGSGLFPATDPLALNVSGFDAAVPQIVNDFIRGNE